MSGGDGNEKGVVEFAKSNLDVLKEISPEQISLYRHRTDRHVHGETAEVQVRKINAMNSRGQSEATDGAQSDFPPSHQIKSQGRQPRAVEDRTPCSRVEVSDEVYRSIAVFG